MKTVFDVAAYILNKQGDMTSMKLQKLCYYAQAWSLAWDKAPMFDERIEAWANGPVVPVLYEAHRDKFQVQSGDIVGSHEAITDGFKATLDAVLDYYGDKSSHWLSELVRSESPWRDSRLGLQPGEPGAHEITAAAMAKYYGSL